jgi:hypothetical protein
MVIILGLLTDQAAAGPTIEALLSIHVKSTVKWRERTIMESLVLLTPIFDPLITSREIKASWQGTAHPTSPSPQIMLALQSLVQACRTLGCPQGAESTVAKQLVEGFVERVRSLDGWRSMEGVKAMQSAMDLGFLAVIAGGDAQNDIVVIKILSKVIDAARVQLSYADDESRFLRTYPRTSR